MNTEQVRAAFEAWIASPPYERKPLGINPEASGLPGQYRAYEVQLAWEAYQAGRAALQSHPTEAFPCRIVEADFETNTVTVEMQGKYTVNAGQKYLCNAPLQLQDREYDPDTIRALLAERDALRKALAALKAENEMLREALKDADNEMDWLDEDMDTCDHSVGVCACSYWSVRRKMKAVLAKENSND